MSWQIAAALVVAFAGGALCALYGRGIQRARRTGHIYAGLGGGRPIFRHQEPELFRRTLRARVFVLAALLAVTAVAVLALVWAAR